MVLENFRQNEWRSESNVSINISKPCASNSSQRRVKNLVQKYEKLSVDAASKTNLRSAYRHSSCEQYLQKSAMLSDVSLNRSTVSRFLSLDKDNKYVINNQNDGNSDDKNKCDIKMPSYKKTSKSNYKHVDEIEREKRQGQNSANSSAKRREDIWKIFTTDSDKQKKNDYQRSLSKNKKETSKDSQQYSQSLPKKKQEYSFGKHFIRSFSATTSRDKKPKSNSNQVDNKLKLLPKDVTSQQKTGAIKKQVYDETIYRKRRDSYLLATQDDQKLSNPETKQNYVSKTITKFEEITDKRTSKFEQEIKHLFQQYHDNKKFGTSNRMTREELSLEIDNVLLNKFKQISRDTTPERTDVASGPDHNENIEETIVVIREKESVLEEHQENTDNTEYVIIMSNDDTTNNLQADSEINVRERLTTELNRVLSEEIKGSFENLCDDIEKVISGNLSAGEEITNISVSVDDNMYDNVDKIDKIGKIDKLVCSNPYNDERIYENLIFIQEKIREAKQNEKPIDCPNVDENTSNENLVPNSDSDPEVQLRDHEDKPVRKVSNLVNYFSDKIAEITETKLERKPSLNKKLTDDDVLETEKNQEFRYSRSSYNPNEAYNPIYCTSSRASSTSSEENFNSGTDSEFGNSYGVSISRIKELYIKAQKGTSSPTVRITSIDDELKKVPQIAQNSLYRNSSFNSTASSDDFEYMNLRKNKTSARKAQNLHKDYGNKPVTNQSSLHLAQNRKKISEQDVEQYRRLSEQFAYGEQSTRVTEQNGHVVTERTVQPTTQVAQNRKQSSKESAAQSVEEVTEQTALCATLSVKEQAQKLQKEHGHKTETKQNSFRKSSFRKISEQFSQDEQSTRATEQNVQKISEPIAQGYTESTTQVAQNWKQSSKEYMAQSTEEVAEQYVPAGEQFVSAVEQSLIATAQDDLEYIDLKKHKLSVEDQAQKLYKKHENKLGTKQSSFRVRSSAQNREKNYEQDLEQSRKISEQFIQDEESRIVTKQSAAQSKTQVKEQTVARNWKQSSIESMAQYTKEATEQSTLCATEQYVPTEARSVPALVRSVPAMEHSVPTTEQSAVQSSHQVTEQTGDEDTEHSSQRLSEQPTDQQVEQKPRFSRLYSGKFIRHNSTITTKTQDTNNNECKLVQNEQTIAGTIEENNENNTNIELETVTMEKDTIHKDDNIATIEETDAGIYENIEDYAVYQNIHEDTALYQNILEDTVFLSDSEGDYDCKEAFNYNNKFNALQKKLSTSDWVQNTVHRIQNLRFKSNDHLDDNEAEQEEPEHIYERIKRSGSQGTLCTIYDEQNNPTIRMSMMDITGEDYGKVITQIEKKTIEKAEREYRKTIEEMQDNSKKACLINELISSEMYYINTSLKRIVVDYMPTMNKENIPNGLLGKSRQIFGNADLLYEEHKYRFFPQLEKHTTIEELAMCFLNHETLFKLYPLYSKNKPKSEIVMRDFGPFFKARQDELNDKLDLASYLLTPIQRLAKYCLLIKSIIKECEKEMNNMAEKKIGLEKLKRAFELLEKQLRMGNDLIALDSVVGYNGSIRERGEVLLRDIFTVTPSSKKGQAFEGMIFLFQDCLMITVINRQDHQELFMYKESFQLTDMGYSDIDPLEFSVWFRKRDNNNFRFRTKNQDLKQKWVKEIFSLLWKQLEANKRRIKKELEENGVKETRVPVVRPYSVPNKGKESPNTGYSNSTKTRKRTLNSSADTVWYLK